MLGLLRVDTLSKSFGGIRAVDNCSFEIDPGKITALIGPNGAGKTTTFQLIAGVMPADQGSIHFDGQDITRLSIHRRAQLGISRTFQMVRVFSNMTIAENLLLAAQPRDQHFWRALFFPHTISNSNVVARELVSRLAAHKVPRYATMRERLKNTLNLVGLQQSLTYPAKDLSYGQSKLLSLARALIMPHKILMLDEPVAGVAPTLRDQFKTLLPKLKKQGETILFIEHDMDFVRAVADHVIVMDQGRLLTQGTPEQVLKDQRVLDAYLGEQL